MPRVHHMVLLKFKPGVREPAITDALHDVARLQQLIPGIESYCGGPYSSPEGLNQGFTHGFLMTFVDADARNRYLTHPDHERVKDALLRLLDNAIAFDIEEPSGPASR
jgi:hypothetical protein